VGGALNELGILDKGRYWYEWGGKHAETDRWAIGSFQRDYISFWNYYFIECEYREDYKYWCFFPPVPNVVDLHGNSVHSEFMTTKSRRPFSLIGLYHPVVPEVPLAGDGTELYRKGKNWAFNKVSLPNAIRQTLLPYGDQVVQDLRYNLSLGDDQPRVPWYHPVILTTARLFILESKVGLSEIRASQGIEDCFREVSSLVMSIQPPSYVNEFVERRVDAFLSEVLGRENRLFGASELWAEMMSRSGSNPGSFIRKTILNHIPCRILVTTFDSFTGVIKSHSASVERLVDDQLQRYLAVGPL
jgi:hypothetical protein